MHATVNLLTTPGDVPEIGTANNIRLVRATPSSPTSGSLFVSGPPRIQVDYLRRLAAAASALAAQIEGEQADGGWTHLEESAS